jgi:hypothetical protein
MNIRLITPVLLIFALFVSCSEKTETKPTSFIRVIHASPDALPMDFKIKDQLLIGSIGYGAATGFQPTDTGWTNYTLRPAGSATGGLSGSIRLLQDAAYTLIAANSSTNMSGSLTRDPRSIPPSGKAFLRVLHLSSDAPGVQILLGGSILYSGRVFSDHANNENLLQYKEINAGTQTLELRVPGSSTVLTSLPNVNYLDGHLYTVCLIGFLNGTGNTALKMTAYDDN